ncbi:hypothetical protein GF345_04635 [Candidatus Woesearchaeota archaeon]|nr:hypothetical protein [Candidatus Woesearchaeota archaeon]
MEAAAVKEARIPEFQEHRLYDIQNDLWYALHDIITPSSDSPNSIDLVGMMGFSTPEGFLGHYIEDTGGLHIAHELVELKQHHEPSYNHSLRTGLFSWAGMRYLSDQDKLDLREKKPLFCLSGLGHDILKLGVPAEVLDKPGALTDDERIIMDSHVSPDSVEFIVRDHYMKGDGFDKKQMDYMTDLIAGHHPGKGLKSINGHAELITIADHMDAAMFRGGYQKKVSPEVFLEYIGRQLSEGAFKDKYAEPFRLMLEEYSRGGAEDGNQ